MAIIYIFSKYATIIPIKTKQPKDILEGLKKGFENMNEKPLTIYSDDEGSFSSKDVKEYFILKKSYSTPYH